MWLLEWVRKVFVQGPKQEVWEPSRSRLHSFLDRSFVLPHEGTFTVIGAFVGGLRLCGKNRLRVQSVETGEICQVTLEHLLEFGTEVKPQSVEGMETENVDPEVERLIGFGSLAGLRGEQR